MSYDRIIRDALRLARAPRRFASGGEIDPNDISPSISNPVSVFPKPQRMFPADAPVPGGQYLGMPDKEDMTGHKSAVASIGVHPGGKPYFNASRDAVDQTGTAGKAKVKTNLFKQKAGWSWQAAPEGHEDTSTIVSVEHRGKHYYTLNAHFPKGVDFARYAESRSEPRLRPTTTGDVFLGPQAGTISVRGKQHPVYHHVVVKADGGAVGYASGGDTTPPRQLNDMGFYSSAAESARSLPQSKGTPQQMLATMKGVKPAELEWSGVQDKFAGQKSVTKDDLAEHFEQNAPDIKETVFSRKRDKSDGPTKQEIRERYEPELLHYNDIDERYNSMIEEGNRHLLTERDHAEYRYAMEEIDRLQTEMHDELDRAEIEKNPPKYFYDYTVGDKFADPVQRNYREVVLNLSGAPKFQSAHWPDNVNTLLHLRMQDRGPDNDILHLEELQSDWAQKGRDRGFGTPTNGYNVQPAPYVTNTDHWMELGLKRALLEAARGGYNKLVWTPGEEQAKRYDLSNHIKDMYYDPDTQHLEYTKVNGKSKIHPSPVSPEDLPKLIGRELADRLLSSKPDYGENSHYLGGLNLKIGGEGMKSFYDKMLPIALRRVLKPHTDKIQPTSHVVKGNDGEDVTLPGIEITPEMRESILKKGFSYYARGGEVRQHFEVGGGADSGSDSGGGFEGSGGGGDSAPEATQDSPAFSTEAPPSYSPPESDPSMLGGATGMAFSPSGSGSLGVGTGNTSGSFLGAAEQQLNTGPGIVGFLGGTPMGLMALGAEKLNEAARAQGYDVVDPGGARPGRGTEQAAREQAAYEAGFPGNRAGGNDSGMIPDPVAPEPSFYGFRLSNDDEETQAGMVRPVGFTPPKPPMMASGGSVPMASGGEVEDQMTGRPLSDKETKDLVGKIQSVLTPDLLEPKYRKQSEGQHPTFGHCASATQAAYYMLGGKESGYVPQVAKEDGGTTHWWLKHRQTGHVIDPTKEQYTSQGEKPPYDRGRGCGFPNPNPDAPSRRGQEIIDRIQRRYEMGGAVPMASGGEVGDSSPMPMTPDQQRMLDDLSAALDRAAARYGTTGYAADPAAQQSPAPRHEPTMPGEPALTRGQEQEYHIGQLQNALARVPTDYPTGPVGYAEGGDVEDNPAVQKALAVTSGVPVTSGAAANFIQNTSNPKRIMVPATGPGGIKGIVIPRHMWEGGNGKHGLIPGLRDINQARAAVYGSQNRDPLTIGKVAEIHKQTLDEHFKRPVDEQIARENEALERLRAAKHIGKSADTLDESEKLDTVRHEYDDQGRPHVGYGSKGVAGYALYSSGHGPNQKFHVLNVCPGSVAGCSGGIDANGIADTSRGTCFAPVAESQYPGAAIRRACHAQAKFDPAMTSDWILAHTGSLRRAAERADKNGERVLFRPNVVDESDRSSRYAIKHLNDQRKAYSESAKLNLPLPDIIANSYGKTTELHDPDNGFFVTYSNTGPKTKLGYSVSENIQRDKQRVRSTILAQDAAGRDFVNDDGEETPPKGSYMVTDVKRDSPLDEKMRKAFKYAKYWSVGRPVSSLSKDEAAEGEEAHYDGKGKPTTPEKAHYGHVTLNGKRYDYQKQHILHRRLVQVGKNKDGSPHMIPTDSRFKDEEFLPSTRYITRSGKPAGHILVTTPTTSTSNAGHQTAFTHHVNESHIAHASKNKGEYEIDSPAAQEASAGKEYAPPKDVGHFAYGGTVDDEIGEHLMAFPERSHYAQIHNVHRSRHNDEKEIGSKRSHGIKSIDRALRLTSQYNQPTRGRP